MLQAPLKPSTYSLRGERSSKRKNMDDVYDDDEEVTSSGKARTKSRRELPTGAVATLKAWLLSPEHFTHPYPTPQDQQMLMQKTGIDKKQLKNWFTNARRRIWKPMLKKQIEQGKLTGTAIPAGMLVGNAVGMDNPHSVQAMRVHYQQAIQGDQAATDTSGSVTMGVAQTFVPAPSTEQASVIPSQFYDPSQQNSSINTLAQVSSEVKMNKTDSHAVLMELFARDQDLVRQATESSRLKVDQQPKPEAAPAPPSAPSPAPPAPAAATAAAANQHPMLKAPNGGSGLHNVPTLNSWPHFSSITSLNNLGTLPGVKSIASLSGQDLASKGNVNKMGNLAQVKSMESMGKNDSYAFLEVFFGDRSSTNLSGMPGARAGIKQEEDNEIGLSLDDESPSQQQQQQSVKKETIAPLAPMVADSGQLKRPYDEMAPAGTTIPSVPTDTGTLKQAYNDAMAARGLLAVSRSSEKLTDLVLPAKIQRTFSQEFVTKQTKEAAVRITEVSSTVGQITEPQKQGDPVQVAATALCVICAQKNVDTQLRPCGHMFHERCLKPSLTNTVGQPKCPCDGIPIASAVLAVPEQER